MTAEDSPRATDENFLSDVFSESKTARQGRKGLRRIADAVVWEFRLRDELLPAERADEDYVLVPVVTQGSKSGERTRTKPLGDRIVAANPEAVLDVVTDSISLRRVKDYTKKGKAARSVYGYGDPCFEQHGARPAERILVCVAADAWFNEYACGWWAATRETRSDLRVDLRSAMSFIWAWGTYDHRALAYALSAARTHPQTLEWMPFQPFTKLYRRVLGLHLDDEEKHARVSEFLSQLTVERLRFVAPGRSAKRHLYGPALTSLRDHHDPSVALDLVRADVDPVEALVRGALPLMRRLFTGEVSPQVAMDALGALAEGAKRVSGGSQ